MRKSDVGDRLNLYAEWYALSKGYRFRDQAKVDVKKLASNAVDELFADLKADADIDPGDPRIAHGEASLGVFVSTMIASLADPTIKGFADQNPGQLGEITFSFARSRLCPLFPICR